MIKIMIQICNIKIIEIYLMTNMALVIINLPKTYKVNINDKIIQIYHIKQKE